MQLTILEWQDLLAKQAAEFVHWYKKQSKDDPLNYPPVNFQYNWDGIFEDYKHGNLINDNQLSLPLCPKSSTTNCLNLPEKLD